jgi:23S rRNA (uracil1939-C5)-methyltransferase
MAVSARVLEIRGVGAQGDGLAEGAYVPYTLPGERIEAAVESGRGELVAMLEASPERVAPPCPHFGECGGCALQHWAPQPYLAWKAEQIKLALARERLETNLNPPWAAPPASRRRLALHARRGPGGVRLGYKARRSWSLVEVAVCPIADPRLVAAFPALRAVAAPFLQHPKSAPTLHVTLTETGLDVDVTGVEKKSGGGPSADARLRAATAAEAADLARLTLDGELLYGSRAPTVRFGRASVALPAGGFLQAVAQAEAAMADMATEAVLGAVRVLDLFSGAGAFSFRLAEHAPVHAVDGSASAIAALSRAVGTAPGLKPLTAEARDLFRRPLGLPELKRFDAVVFDPPRAGAAAQAAELAKAGASVIVGVSCNPATFARDARLLVDGGFRLESVTPVDQFLWSPHIELVGVFRR